MLEEKEECASRPVQETHHKGLGSPEWSAWRVSLGISQGDSLGVSLRGQPGGVSWRGQPGWGVSLVGSVREDISPRGDQPGVRSRQGISFSLSALMD